MGVNPRSRNAAIIYAAERGYEVTDQGEARSPSGGVRKLRWRQGYASFSVKVPRSLGGKAKHIAVHRLAAYLRFGESVFDADVEVRHLDCDSTNNCPSNLALGTHSENSLDRPLARRIEEATHAASFVRKLDEETVRGIKRMRDEGAKWKDIQARFGVSKTSVWSALKQQAA